jgi:hypothetical protein
MVHVTLTSFSLIILILNFKGVHANLMRKAISWI